MRKVKRALRFGLFIVTIFVLINRGLTYYNEKSLNGSDVTPASVVKEISNLTGQSIEKTVSEAVENVSNTYIPVTTKKKEIITSESLGEIRVTFIDVGQGDSILVEDNGHNMLIDTGYYSEYENLTATLNEHSVDTIDCLVLTHPDADHIQSAPEIISEYSVQKIYTTNIESESKSYEYLQKIISLFGVDVVYPSAGDYIDFGTATYYVAGPVKNEEGIYDDVNSYSLIIKIINGNDSFLLTGDATGDETKDILNAGIDVSAMVYKAAHHGSANDGCNEDIFVNAVNPQIAVISCGLDNSYGHPHRETMQLFNNKELYVYRTDTMGSISFLSTGNSISVITEK